MTIGFFGTGLMGEPMALNLLNAGYKLNIYNRTEEKMKAFVSKEAEIFTDSAEAIKNSDVLISMLSDYEAINSVFNRNFDFSGKTMIQMSTVAPEENAELARFFTSCGCEFLEAPVLGSIPQVKSKELIVIVSGSEKYYTEFLPLFKAFGKKIVYMQDYGKASAAKLALNQLIATETTAFSMSLGFIREYGVDTEKFMEILRNSALYAPTFDKKLDRMLERNFAEPNFPLKHLLKDVNLMIDSFSAKGINTETLLGVKKVIEEGLSLGHSEDDYSSLYNSIHRKQELN